MTSPWAYISSIWVLIAKVQCKVGERHAPIALVGVELESGKLIEIGVPKLFSIKHPPYPTGPQTLVVCVDADELVACHIALGWRLPDRIVDLMVEFRVITNGNRNGVIGGLGGALIWFGKRTAGAFATGSSPREMRTRLAAVVELYHALRPSLDLGRAILRGRYMRAVACIETVGVPVDRQALDTLREHWRTVSEMAWASPRVRALEAPRALLTDFEPSLLSVGRDGRNRVPLRPFTSRTGRNQPSAKAWLLGTAAWSRHLIRPEPGTGLAMIDWEQQEFGIAAALSGDQRMQAAYTSGDPYMALAIAACAAPERATAATHSDIREGFKRCALGVQYGMGRTTLARQLAISEGAAAELISGHKATLPRFWSWSDAVEAHAFQYRELRSVFGWRLAVGADANPRSVRNFPVQANGGEMLRLACCLMTEAGIKVCAPNHDAVMIEAPLSCLEATVAEAQRIMAEASTIVLDGFALRTSVKIVQAPDRWSDPRGQVVWSAVEGAINARTGPAHRRNVTCS